MQWIEAFNAPSSTDDSCPLYPLCVRSRFSNIREVVQNSLGSGEILLYEESRAAPECIEREDVEDVESTLREVIHRKEKQKDEVGVHMPDKDRGLAVRNVRGSRKTVLHRSSRAPVFRYENF